MKRRRVKSKFLKGKSRPQALPLTIHEGTLKQPHGTFWEKVKDHPTFWLVNVLSAFLAIVFAISDAFREPEIHHSIAQIDDPFSVRFSLHNPSVIFQMTDMRINCALLRVELEYNLSLVGLPVYDGIVANIPPDKTVEYECPIRKFVGDLGQIDRATIRIDAKFRTLGYERATESEVFNWDVNSRQWTEGEIIN